MAHPFTVPVDGGQCAVLKCQNIPMFLHGAEYMWRVSVCVCVCVCVCMCVCVRERAHVYMILNNESCALFSISSKSESVVLFRASFSLLLITCF